MNIKNRTAYNVYRTMFLMFLAVMLGAGCTQASNNEQQTANDDSVVVAITEVFQDNYTDKADQIVVSVTESQGDLVVGNVTMPDAVNHKFYAAKVDGEWDVIYDPEQKAYDCDTLRGYAFPENMIVGCKEPVVEFTIGDAQEIQGVFANIYHKNVEDVTIKVDKYDATHARGSVQFASEQGGGMFLAVKDMGAWDVVVDGNGSYSCEAVSVYNFPEDMIADCIQN